MNIPALSLAAVLTLGAGGSAWAGALSDRPRTPDDRDAIGHWIYDASGNILGSVRGLTDDGRTALVMVGAYFQPGSHLVAIPADQLVTRPNGRVALRSETLMALDR